MYYSDTCVYGIPVLDVYKVIAIHRRTLWYLIVLYVISYDVCLLDINTIAGILPCFIRHVISYVFELKFFVE